MLEPGLAAADLNAGMIWVIIFIVHKIQMCHKAKKGKRTVFIYFNVKLS